jgi:hypothetical protein
MSVKRFIFYEMFKFICPRNEVKITKDKQYKQDQQNKQSQKKQNIINPANLKFQKNHTELNKISPETINKFNPKIDENFYIERKNHANVNKFIKNYNEINKTKFPPIEE